MTDREQPESLRLADWLETDIPPNDTTTFTDVADELRRLYEENQALRERLSQPEPEPFAWVHRFIEGGISIGKKPADLDKYFDRWKPLYEDPTPCKTCEALARTVMMDQTSHDTAPPKHEWVGLTE